MMAQALADGLINGAVIGLGAIGVTLTYSILRFANFAHGELLSWGAYFALLVNGALGFAFAGLLAPIGPFSFGWSLPLSIVIAAGLTALLALLVDALLFGPLRRRGSAVIIVVMASFGAALALRNFLEFLFTSQPRYFSDALQIAVRFWGVRATPDQIATVVLAAVLALALHLLMTQTAVGRSMRAVAENPQLAGVAGIDVRKVVRWVWILGAGLAAVAGAMSGLVVQIRPQIGLDLLLPLFAAAILGGIGSVPGAMLAGLIVGLGESFAVRLVGAEWRAGVAFLVLVAVLLTRPQGLFGRSA
ncbi:MAG: branched-chain amino acid ABC transporter permease [Mesorhizobium amorphae]|nr:MAG: branched-chain amino acid ABC transporter permease [Mesorhizobium amorphae]